MKGGGFYLLDNIVGGIVGTVIGNLIKKLQSDPYQRPLWSKLETTLERVSHPQKWDPNSNNLQEKAY